MSFLSAAGFGAKLIGIFTNGLVQSFIDAETLKPEGLFLLGVRIFFLHLDCFAAVLRRSLLRATSLGMIHYTEPGNQSLVFSTTADMGKPALVPLIAKELRRLHDANIPISRKPEVWQSIHKFLDEGEYVVFKIIMEWVENVPHRSPHPIK